MIRGSTTVESCTGRTISKSYDKGLVSRFKIDTLTQPDINSFCIMVYGSNGQVRVARDSGGISGVGGRVASTMNCGYRFTSRRRRQYLVFQQRTAPKIDMTLLSRSIESGPRGGTTNASTSCVIVPRVIEKTNPTTSNGEPFAAHEATAVGGTGWIMTEHKVGCDFNHA